jgi:hypothetical protein
MPSRKKKVLERSGLPLWVWMIGGVLVVSVSVLALLAVQIGQHLRAVQIEVQSAKEEAIRAKSTAAKVEHVAESLGLRLESAERELQRLNEAVEKGSAEASEQEKQIALLRQGKARCDEFFQEWEPKSSPASILALFGIAREATAAKDCIDKGDVATACRHWRGLLVQIEKIGPPVSESRGEIEKLIQQHKCKN